jgi:hypothetical protein
MLSMPDFIDGGVEDGRDMDGGFAHVTAIIRDSVNGWADE